MAQFCVSYELTQRGRDYSDLVAALRSYRPSWQGMQSVWIVGSRSATCQDVFEQLRIHMHPDDRLLVVPIDPSAGWWSQGIVADEAPHF
jgi:hypothetical protein